MKTPRCKKKECGWRGNPTDDPEGAQSQIDEHMAAAHPTVIEVTSSDSAAATDEEV